jgi:hypothetical protein
VVEKSFLPSVLPVLMQAESKFEENYEVISCYLYFKNV